MTLAHKMLVRASERMGESGAPRQSLAAFVLFITNVAAILASGIVVMGLYRVHRFFGQEAAAGLHRGGAVAPPRRRRPGLTLMPSRVQTRV